jgi:hypothetical protein
MMSDRIGCFSTRWDMNRDFSLVNRSVILEKVTKEVLMELPSQHSRVTNPEWLVKEAKKSSNAMHGLSRNFDACKSACPGFSSVTSRFC